MASITEFLKNLIYLKNDKEYKVFKFLFIKLRFRRPGKHDYTLQPLEIKPEMKCLIVSPHPDDESFGCGRLLLKYPRQCEVLLLTNGEQGDYRQGAEQTKEIRRQEFEAAMDFAGVSQYSYLNLPDKNVRKHLKKLNSLKTGDYDFIFVPNENERHVDHNCLWPHMLKLISKQKSKARLMGYEVWGTIGIPGYYLDISDIAAKKLQLTQIYQSQLGHLHYDLRMQALNYYRGLLVDKEYIEVYQHINKNC